MLTLLSISVITQNSPAAKYLPEAEVQKRVQSLDARRALLRSNPSLYVSKTRLSVRRLPLFVSERTLRKLAFHAVKTFDAEAKAGSRDGLHPDELVVDEDDVEGQKAMKPRWSKGGKKIGGGPIKQAKIVRQQDRNDALTGNPRSKGYGFIEMRTHADALRVLRWANNNPAAIEHVQTLWKVELEELVKTTKDDDDEGKARKKRATEALEALEVGKGKKKDGTMIVEFSIENVQVIQRRSAREHDSREKARFN
jgi:nucleolar protein 4